MNQAELYYLTGKILALDYHPRGREALPALLPRTTEQWQQWVKTASDNKVLAAAFLSLQRHQLLSCLPADLQEYLQYVLELNRERNQKIIHQLKEVNTLFQGHGISFLVMKGVGHMLDGLYGDVGERMVYDTDILVEPDKMMEAARLMHQQGYITQKEFNPRALESTMHYPILLREDKVAGVEIHRMPVQYLYHKHFDGEKVFARQVSSRQIPGFRLMHPHHRIVHNFMHAQLMHSGHYHAQVSLRDLYDLLLMSREENLQEVFAQWGYFPSAAQGYLKLMYKCFGLEMPRELSQSRRGKGLLRRHKRVLTMNPGRRKWYLVSIMAAQKYLVLPARILWNRQARNYVFARLFSVSWYGAHFRAVKRILRRKS